MDENYTPSVLDKRLAKGIIKGIVYDHINSNLKYLLAFSPKTIADELEIGDPSSQPVWVLAGSVEVEDRMFEHLHTPTSQKEVRASLDNEPDPFKYPIASDPTRSEQREPLPNREAVIVCFKCDGKGEIVDTCPYCGGKSYLVCDKCSGKGSERVACPDCRGERRKRDSYSSDYYFTCNRCMGGGSITQACKKCGGSGISSTRCSKCENGKTVIKCPKCQGHSFLLEKTNLWVRTRTLRIKPEPLEPEVSLPLLLPETAEHFYTTPPLLLKDLRTHRSSLPPQVWERVATRLAQKCALAIQKGNEDEPFQSQIKTVQASVYLATAIRAQFQFKDRTGSIWVALGGKNKVIDYSLSMFGVRFSDFARDLIALFLFLTLGAALSWSLATWFPLLTMALAGVLTISALRYLEWSAEFSSLVIRGVFSFLIFAGIVGILTVSVQTLYRGQLDSQTLIALVVLAVMTAFAIAGIQSEQIGKFFGEFIKTIYRK